MQGFSHFRPAPHPAPHTPRGMPLFWAYHYRTKKDKGFWQSPFAPVHIVQAITYHLYHPGCMISDQGRPYSSRWQALISPLALPATNGIIKAAIEPTT